MEAEKENAGKKCNRWGMLRYFIVGNFLEVEEQKLNMPEVKGPIYKDNITYATLEVATRIYIYLGLFEYCVILWAPSPKCLVSSLPPPQAAAPPWLAG